jgi:hypothetical protein
MGIEIGPLIAGAGVLGVAIGFGAQTLVKDIISGMFFLLDDAFRVGEYIQSGNFKGTVESFSLRSVKLRHLNGQLHTVPFGDLKAITNYSRDWVVETLHLVVTYDTDLDLLEDVVAAVSAELMADPVLGPEMIEPLRSLGVQAMVVRSGGTLYTDIFDRKPPLPPLLYAASFSVTSSTDVRLMRVLMLVLLALCGVLVALDCWRRWGPVSAWWGGVLIIAGSMALFPADAGAANYAHFALLPGTAAILWSRRGTLPSALAAGVALGAAVLCRQSWLLGVVPACVSVGLYGRWRNIAPFLAGAALTIATTGFYAPFGRFWEWNVTDSPGFVFAGINPWSAAGKGLASIAGFVAFHPVLTVATIVVVAAGITALKQRKLPADIDLWLWVASGLAAWAAGLRFFGHYWLQVVPPLVLLSVPVVSRWASRARTLAISGLVVPAVVAWALLFVPGSFRDRPDPSRLVAFVTAHTSSTDRVFIWGSFPEVLVEADRLPAGGLVHTDFVVGRSGGRTDPRKDIANALPAARDVMLASLARTPPKLILDTSTSDALGYSRFPTSLVPQLDTMIHADYQKIAVVDGVTIWQRIA